MLYLITPNGLSVFWPLVEYLKARPNTSLSWARQTSRALGLLYDYSVAVANLGLSRQEIFRRFSLSLCHGTIDTETYQDKTGLYWAPGSVSVQKKMCSSITRFIAWKDETSRKEDPVFLRYLEEVPPSLKRLLTASKIIASKSMLYHTKDVKMLAEGLDKARHFFGMELGNDPRESIGNIRTVNDFPSELIPQLITHGFIRDPHATDPFEREDMTAKMITILLAGGGLRKGEPFHLWFNDVMPEPAKGCTVTLFHPSGAQTCFRGNKQTREQYLAQRKMLPRNRSSASKSHHATWKSLAVDKKTLSAPVYFIHESYSFLFWEMYLLYMKRYRPLLMESYKANHGTEHPFLFVSNGEDRGASISYRGAPYSMAAFDKSFERALGRLEKKLGRKLPRGRDYGLNPHALRHHVGHVMAEAGVEPKIIQNVMHHRTIDAQEVYKKLPPDKVQKILASYTLSSQLNNIGMVK
ncbi:tyrosine-type recombinase/integrase [Aeromonas allosaccharophila]|uniref:tyrosine-type recombinase/integrase n=1 Tax=Aeromonas allosaccharophila TaxID=656 RepID=UPI001F188C2F|nr:tyrosine-type recombinase/integrase [Aeromonas allosaccharophila]MCE9848851.1 tyrosine-type recombinase/integrase [Aeromonas allosaccharophila]